MPRALVGLGLYFSALGLLALGIGTLIRHVAAAITATLVVVVALPALAALLPVGDVDSYLPSQTGLPLMSTSQAPPGALSPWPGYALLCLQALSLLAVAGYLVRRRDT